MSLNLERRRSRNLRLFGGPTVASHIHRSHDNIILTQFLLAGRIHIKMWQKQIAVLLLICIIVQGTAANLFSEDEGVVVDDSHAPAWEQHRMSPHLFAAPEEEEAERYTCRSIVAIAYSRRQPSGRKSDAVKQGQRTLRKRDKTTDESSDMGEEEDHQEEGFSCELEDGSNAPIEATPEQLDEMRAALTNGTLISAVSTMDVDLVDVVDGDEQVDVGSGDDTPPSHSKSAKLPPGPIHLSSDSRRLVEHQQRRLNNRFIGPKKLLVIRVTDDDGKAPPEDAAFYSNKFFGTNGDKETPKAQMYGCSAGGKSVGLFVEMPHILRCALTFLHMYLLPLPSSYGPDLGFWCKS